MRLSEEKFNELKQDEFVQTAIAMMKSEMLINRYIMHNRERNTLEGGRNFVKNSIQTLKDLLDNSMLRELLEIDKSRLKRYLNAFINNKQDLDRSGIVRIGKYHARNRWLKELLENLKRLGLNRQADRTDFTYQIIKEYDLQGFSYGAYISKKNYDNIDDYYKGAEDSIKRVLRKIDSL